MRLREPEWLIPALWIAWLLYWLAAARDVKPVRRREHPVSRAVSSLPLLLAAYLLSVPLSGRLAVLDRRFLPYGPWFPLAGTVAVIAGLAYAVWARRHLGREWSGVVTLKADHRLIVTGPYQRVRHPIYTGLLLALAGSAAALGEWRGLLGLLLALGAVLRRVAIEERWLGEAFGAEYAAYRQRTAALVPGVF